MVVQDTSLVVTNPVAQQSPSTKRSLKKRPSLVDVLSGRAKHTFNRQASRANFCEFVNILYFKQAFLEYCYFLIMIKNYMYGTVGLNSLSVSYKTCHFVNPITNTAVCPVAKFNKFEILKYIIF